MDIPQSAYPLSWPVNWKRHTYRETARFGDHSVSTACNAIQGELRKLGASRIIISTNLELRLDGLPYSNRRAPADPGVAVYFQLKGTPTVLACDKWNKVEHNLWAIAKDIEAIRGRGRWGVGTVEQAFFGYKALPEKSSTYRHWRDVFGYLSTARIDRESLDLVYKALCHRMHPDKGGTHEAFIELQNAYNQAKKEVL